MPSILDTFRTILRNTADRNNDNAIDQNDALLVARDLLSRRLGIDIQNPAVDKSLDTATEIVAAAGMMREISKQTGPLSILSSIFGNDDLIRGLVALAISTVIKSQTGITIPPKQLNEVIERVLDWIKGRRRKTGPTDPGSANPPSATKELPASAYLPETVFDAPRGPDSELDAQLVTSGYVRGRDYVYVAKDGSGKWGVGQANHLPIDGFRSEHRIGG